MYCTDCNTSMVVIEGWDMPKQRVETWKCPECGHKETKILGDPV